MTVEEKKTCGFYHLNSAASVQRKPAVAQWEHKLDFDLFFFFYSSVLMTVWTLFPFVQMKDWLNHKLRNFLLRFQEQQPIAQDKL